eukprot:831286-Prymnesium_polylepis.1
MPSTVFRFTPSAEGVRVVRTDNPAAHVLTPGDAGTAGAPASSASASATLAARHGAECSLLEDALRSARSALGYPDGYLASELAPRANIEDVTDEPLRLLSSQLWREEDPLVAEAFDEEEEAFCMPSLVQHAPTTRHPSSPTAGNCLFANATSGARAAA